MQSVKLCESIKLICLYFSTFLEAYHTFLQITWPEVEGAWTFDRLYTIWLGFNFKLQPRSYKL